MMDLSRNREEFAKHGYTSIKGLFRDQLGQIQEDTEKQLKENEQKDAPIGAKKTYNHLYNLPEDFILRRLSESDEFTSMVREITGKPKLALLQRDPEKGYESNLFTSKLNVYPKGGTNFRKHFDVKIIRGPLIALVYTVSSDGGKHMKLRVNSNRSGNQDQIELEPGTLTIHDANDVFHEVLKPDPDNRRVAYLMQFVDEGESPKEGLEKMASFVEAGAKTTVKTIEEEPYEYKISLVLNSFLLAFLIGLVVMSKFFGQIRSFATGSGGLIGALSLFFLLNLNYFSVESEKDTEYGYIFCRHLRDMPMSLAILMSANAFLCLMFVIYSRFRSIPPLLALLALVLVLSLVAQGKTMGADDDFQHWLSTTIFFSLALIFLALLYPGISFIGFSLLFVLFSVIGPIRASNEKKGCYDKTVDLAFSVITYMGYFSLLLAFLINTRRQPTTVETSLERNHRKIIGVIAVVAVLVVIRLVAG